jgi:hypothetical protein
MRVSNVGVPTCSGGYCGTSDVFKANDWVEVELEAISALTPIIVPPFPDSFASPGPCVL